MEHGHRKPTYHKGGKSKRLGVSSTDIILARHHSSLYSALEITKYVLIYHLMWGRLGLNESCLQIPEGLCSRRRIKFVLCGLQLMEVKGDIFQLHFTKIRTSEFFEVLCISLNRSNLLQLAQKHVKWTDKLLGKMDSISK